MVTNLKLGYQHRHKTRTVTAQENSTSTTFLEEDREIHETLFQQIYFGSANIIATGPAAIILHRIMGGNIYVDSNMPDGMIDLYNPEKVGKFDNKPIAKVSIDCPAAPIIPSQPIVPNAHNNRWHYKFYPFAYAAPTFPYRRLTAGDSRLHLHEIKSPAASVYYKHIVGFKWKGHGRTFIGFNVLVTPQQTVNLCACMEMNRLERK